MEDGLQIKLKYFINVIIPEFDNCNIFVQEIILVLGKYALKHCGAQGQDDHNLLSNSSKNMYVHN